MDFPRESRLFFGVLGLQGRGIKGNAVELRKIYKFSKKFIDILEGKA
jgi:hypothetical protein